MDPFTIVGLVASITQLVDVTTRVIQYLNGVKNAPKNKARLEKECSLLLVLLTDLRDWATDADPDDTRFPSVQSLGSGQGALEILKHDLTALSEKLESKSRWKAAVMWPFDEKDINTILYQIERGKNSIGLALQKDHFKLTIAIDKQNQEISSQVTSIAESVREQEVDKKTKEHQDVVSWLSSLNFGPRQADALSRRQPGTGAWLLDTDTFKNWMSGHFRALWYNGAPGAGKTVMASIVIDSLQRKFGQSTDIAIAYIYFNYKERQSLQDLILNLLQQLVRTRPAITEQILIAYKRHKSSQSKLHLDDACMMLRHEIDAFSNVFVVIDALDECEEDIRDVFIATLMDLPANAYLLVTSRSLPTIEQESGFTTKLEIRATDEDVKKYVGNRLFQSGPMLRRIKGDQALHSDIVDTLVANANGMFLLAQLHMDSLAKKLTKKDVRLALRRLPESLDQIYEEVMKRIHQQDTDRSRLAIHALSWITHAFRPLTVPELQCALSITSETEEIDPEAFPDEREIIEVCAGLVHIEEESNVIRLVHYTTQEYFERTRSHHFPHAHIQISKSCLDILALCCDKERVLEMSDNQLSLRWYARENWGDHAREDDELQIKDRLLKAVKQKTIVDFTTLDGDSYRAMFSAGEVSQTLLSDDQGSALLACAHYGLERIASTLLGYVAVELQSCETSAKLIHIAAYYGRADMVRQLLDHGADIDSIARSRHYILTPLGIAARQGHKHVARLLLERRAQFQKINDYVDPPMAIAASSDMPGIVQILLAHGTRVNEKFADGKTALHYASRDGNEDVMKLLLDHHADTEITDKSGRTAIHFSTKSAVCRMLLDAGSDVDAADLHGNTILQRCIIQSPGKLALVEIAKVVLDHKADLGHRNRRGETVFTLCITHNKPDLFRLLMTKEPKDADLRQDSWSDLHFAIGFGAMMTAAYPDEANSRVQKGRFLELLDRGPDMEARDELRQTPLFWAVKACRLHGQDHWLKILINRGSQLEARDALGDTALHRAIDAKILAAVRILVDAGADIKSQDRHGVEARYLRSHKEVRQILLRAGDKPGRNTTIEEAA